MQRRGNSSEIIKAAIKRAREGGRCIYIYISSTEKAADIAFNLAVCFFVDRQFMVAVKEKRLIAWGDTEGWIKFTVTKTKPKVLPRLRKRTTLDEFPRFENQDQKNRKILINELKELGE